jgi:hypothetical protein
MKTRNLFSTAMMVAILIPATSMYAQGNKEVRVAFKGSVYMVGIENGLGLEVGWKLVVAKNYRNFQTHDEAKYFAVEAKDGKLRCMRQQLRLFC